MRTLSEVFEPGAPTLPEGLRTLVVSPERELEPGMTVRAAFTFRNQGGAPATGVRVRFTVPDGLVYLVGSGELDGRVLDDELGNSPLLSRGGAAIGDVAPGEERRIDIAYSVAGAIENGTTIELQAAVASFELSPVGSNVVRLVARSRPELRNNLTTIAIECVDATTPGSQALVTVRVHNAGESSAHDVVIVAPIPEHAEYVAASARVNGRDFEQEHGGGAFDRLYAPIVTRTLGAGASATLTYRIRIDAPLSDGTEIAAVADIASQETAAFALAAATLVVRSAPDFGGESTSLHTDPSSGVRPGERVTLTLVAHNAGTACAETVAATLELPDALIPVRGATTIDGRAVRERRKDGLQFDLGRLDAGGSAQLRIETIVAAPLPDATALAVAATLAWSPAGAASTRRLERDVAVTSQPALAPRRNALVRAAGDVARPGNEVEAVAIVANDGSAAAHDVVLHLRADSALEDLRVFEKSTRLPLDGDTLDLGTLEPYASRRFALRARVRSPYPNRSEIRAAASLHTRELGETPLGEAIWRVDSHPAFSPETSRLAVTTDDVLRPNQLADVDVTAVNAGTDVAHGVRLRLYVSPEARLESVEGAVREKSSLLFGEVLPGAKARARLGLRLLRGLAKEYPVTVDAVLSADAMVPVPLARLTISTSAEPDFSIGTLRADANDTVDAGDTLEWTLHVRNGGDGPARRAFVAVVRPESLIYVPNSTTVNDVPVRDDGTMPTFATGQGIVLNDVDPGVEAVIGWRDVVHNRLAAGEAIVVTARIGYDGDRSDDIVSDELKVRATPEFANAIPGLPFGLEGAIGPSLGGPRALTQERYLELPPATPVAEGNGSVRALAAPHAAISVGASLSRQLSRTGTAAGFTSERLQRTLRFLDEARFEGTIAHLFALRALLPDAIGDGHVAALAALRDLLRDELDRLFIKLRLPGYTVAPRDVETPSLRGTIERVLHDAASAHGAPADPPGAALVVRGGFDPAALGEALDRLEGADLARAQPWAALARLLPDSLPELDRYRRLLAQRFDAAGELEARDFLDALQHRGDADLDGALDDVRTALALDVPTV